MRCGNSLLGSGSFAVPVRRCPCSRPGKSPRPPARPLRYIEKAHEFRHPNEPIPCWQGIARRRSARHREGRFAPMRLASRPTRGQLLGCLGDRNHPTGFSGGAMLIELLQNHEK